MQDSFQGGLNLEQGWPLRDLDRIIIHLNDLDSSLLKDGDSYFCLCHGYYNNVQLVLRHMISGHLREYPVLESDYQKLFAMDWLNNISVQDADDLTTLLDHCLTAAEQGVTDMTLDKVTLSVYACHDSQSGDEAEDLPSNVESTSQHGNTFNTIKSAFITRQQSKLGTSIEFYI